MVILYFFEKRSVFLILSKEDRRNAFPRNYPGSWGDPSILGD
jgi:hypothetical protein